MSVMQSAFNWTFLKYKLAVILFMVSWWRKSVGTCTNTAYKSLREEQIESLN
jgi:hypothetical protein